ncbi:hypothetical protein [Ruminococcus sp.]|nr:hypothetical protein [Ruminococcus sp.]
MPPLRSNDGTNYREYLFSVAVALAFAIVFKPPNGKPFDYQNLR